jgi:hypothetical protein
MKYDPHENPDPAEWLALDEAERIVLIGHHHREAGVKLPNLQLHAAIHAVVENQIAMGDQIPVRRTLERLLGEGLDRHDAIHAIGSVLASHLHAIMTKTELGPDPNDAYYRELESLTAERWRKSGQETDEDDR